MTDAQARHGRRWPRLIAAVLYLACILAPHAALAGSQAAAHCPSDTTVSNVHQAGEPAASHVHGDDHDHRHADQAPATAVPDTDRHAGTCCGVFCLTGLAPSPVVNLAIPGDTARVAADPDHSVEGRGPDRIIRPPKA